MDAILLYYHFVDLRNIRTEVSTWYRESCQGLVGRVRVAFDGVNATLGGAMDDLRAHIHLVREHFPDRCHEIDFKLASYNSDGCDAKARLQSGFSNLSVHLCKEVVSMGVGSKLLSGELPIVPSGARHVSPEEFNGLLEQATNAVILDVRNQYETRVGRFLCENATSVDPNVRCFSDIPRWMDNNKSLLNGRQIFMVCTGGVRCERSSCHLSNIVDSNTTEVFQLHGGIQRYLEAFPDGGKFKGKNFVFDERVTVSPMQGTKNNIIGMCLECQQPWDEYTCRARCPKCRMLILLCPSCCDSKPLCELCTAQQENIKILPKKLKILALHGFRQTSANFKGRTAALRKKLSSGGDIDFLFVDGPHSLPLPQGLDSAKPRRAWLLTPEQYEDRATMAIDTSQYLRQSAGWVETRQSLDRIIKECGPFDGIFGFSQGAGIAAALCALYPHDFRFVMCASGYIPAVPGLETLLVDIPTPSLHIYSTSTGDCQVLGEDSCGLASAFTPENRHTVHHTLGHIIPATNQVAERILTFLHDLF